MLDLFRPTRRFALAAVLSALSFAAAPGVVRAEDGDKKEEGDKPEKVAAQTPEEAFAQLKEAVKKKDKDRFWSLLGKESQKKMEEMGAMLKEGDQDKAETAKKLGVTEEQLDEMSPRDYMLAALFAEDNAENLEDLQKMELKDVKVEGEKAVGKRVEGETEEKAYFIKEDGEWKLDLAAEMGDEGHDGHDHDGDGEPD